MTKKAPLSGRNTHLGIGAAVGETEIGEAREGRGRRKETRWMEGNVGIQWACVRRCVERTPLFLPTSHSNPAATVGLPGELPELRQ